MPQHVMSVPCLRVLKDEDTGLYSYIDIVDTAYIKDEDEPNIPSFKLVSKWIRETVEMLLPDVFELKISLKGPGEKRKKSIGKLVVEIPEDAIEVIASINIATTEVPSLGQWLMFVDYKSENDKKWKQATVLPFLLTRSKGKKGNAEEGEAE